QNLSRTVAALSFCSLTLCAQALKLKMFSACCRIMAGRVVILREEFLSRFLISHLRACIIAAFLGLLAPLCAAQNSAITLDTSETLFSVLTAMNACGYDANLNGSDAQRLNIRAEVQRNLRDSEEAQGALKTMCDWYVAHRGKDPRHDLSQFISLALYLQGPPHFLPRVKEDELPPDAMPIVGFGALLEHFYEKAQLHEIWE